MPIDLLDLLEGEEKPKSTKKTKSKREIDPVLSVVLASQRGAWIYELARTAAREAAYETLREFLEIMTKSAPKDDDIDKELKRLQLEELKDRLRLKRQLRSELIPIIKSQLSQLTLQQQLSQALADCVKRKKAKLIKELRRKGLPPWEIQVKLLEAEADIYESCEEEIKGVLGAYQGDVEPEELPVPDEDEEEDYSGSEGEDEWGDEDEEE